MAGEVWLVSNARVKPRRLPGFSRQRREEDKRKKRTNINPYAGPRAACGAVTSIYLLANLLKGQGKLVEATPLYTELLEGYVLLHGMEVLTRITAKDLVSNSPSCARWASRRKPRRWLTSTVWLAIKQRPAEHI